jgi:hypothetical protein
MKAFVILFLVVSGIVGIAQEDKSGSFIPSKNNFSFEVNFTPFNADAPIDISGFNSRLFLTDKLALRMGFNFDMGKNYEEMPYETSDALYYESTEESYTTIGVNTGIEYHFLDSKRVSPYIGAIIGFEDMTSKSVYKELYSAYNGMEYTYLIRTTEAENMWLDEVIYYDPETGYYIFEEMSHRGYLKISGMAVLGADVYIVKHFYMGVELGLGINATTYKEITVTIDGDPEPGIPKAKETNFGLNVNNAIRLGFWF